MARPDPADRPHGRRSVDGADDVFPASPATVGELAARVRRARPRLGEVRLVCIDGPAGSGKTTLAADLADALVAARPGSDVGVVHMDDVYEGWDGLEGGFALLDTAVLGPLAEGRAGRLGRYDWESGRRGAPTEVPVPDVLVVEGCGSAPRALGPRAVLTVFVEAPPGVRLARGLARDGAALRDRWTRWMADEADHFAREGTRRRADVVVDGAPPGDGRVDDGTTPGGRP